MGRSLDLNFADLSHEGCPFQTRSLELSPTTGTVSFSNGIPTNYAFDVRDDYLVGTPVDFHCAQNGDDLVTYSPGIIHVVPLVFTNALTVVEVASDQTTNLYFPDPPPRAMRRALHLGHIGLSVSHQRDSFLHDGRTCDLRAESGLRGG